MDLKKFFMDELKTNQFYSAEGEPEHYAEGEPAHYAEGEDFDFDENFDEDIDATGRIRRKRFSKLGITNVTSPAVQGGVAKPIVFTISNLIDKSIQNIELFNAVEAVGKVYGVVDGTRKELIFGEDINITFSYGMSYQSFVNYLNSGSVYRIAKQLQLCTNSTTLLSTFMIQQKDEFGRLSQDTYAPNYNTFQYQTAQIEVIVDYYLTKATKFIFNYIAPETEIQFRLYPSIYSGQTSVLNAGANVNRIPTTSGIPMLTIGRR